MPPPSSFFNITSPNLFLSDWASVTFPKIYLGRFSRTTFFWGSVMWPVMTSSIMWPKFWKIWFFLNIYKWPIVGTGMENLTKWDQNEVHTSSHSLFMTILLKTGEDPSYYYFVPLLTPGGKNFAISNFLFVLKTFIRSWCMSVPSLVDLAPLNQE